MITHIMSYTWEDKVSEEILIKNYQRAIEILEHELDYKELVYRVAKMRPDVFVMIVDNYAAAGFPVLPPTEFKHETVALWTFKGWDFTLQQRNEIFDYLCIGEKIQAIKYTRALFDIGLKEAKELIDAMCDQKIWKKYGYMDGPNTGYPNV